MLQKCMIVVVYKAEQLTNYNTDIVFATIFSKSRWKGRIKLKTFRVGPFTPTPICMASWQNCHYTYPIYILIENQNCQITILDPQKSKPRYLINISMEGPSHECN